MSMGAMILQDPLGHACLLYSETRIPSGYCPAVGPSLCSVIDLDDSIRQAGREPIDVSV